jgi:hypothetical protein
MVSKRVKESKEYANQEEQAAKKEGEIEKIILDKGKKEPQQRELTLEEQIILMTEIEYRTMIIGLLSEILHRLKQQNEQADKE